jgi:outer membrane lipoprotein SlyB
MKTVSQTQTKRRTRALIAGALFTILSDGYAGAEVPTSPATPPAATTICTQCGMVENVREVSQEGESTGLGSVAGGLLGGILGRQLGEDGSTLGMLLGMAGGAYAGNKFEQYRNKTTRYEVSMRMDDGTLRVLTFDSRPAWQIGERVRLGNSGPVRAQPGQPSQPDASRMAYGNGTSI